MLQESALFALYGKMRDAHGPILAGRREGEAISSRIGGVHYASR